MLLVLAMFAFAIPALSKDENELAEAKKRLKEHQQILSERAKRSVSARSRFAT
jgi:hypothetical protein